MVIEIFGLPGVGKSTLSDTFLNGVSQFSLTRKSVLDRLEKNLHNIPKKNEELMEDAWKKYEKSSTVFLLEAFFEDMESAMPGQLSILRFFKNRHRKLFRQRIQLLANYLKVQRYSLMLHKDVLLDEGVVNFGLSNITNAEMLGYAFNGCKDDYVSELRRKDIRYVYLWDGWEAAYDRYRSRPKKRFAVEALGDPTRHYKILSDNADNFYRLCCGQVNKIDFLKCSEIKHVRESINFN